MVEKGNQKPEILKKNFNFTLQAKKKPKKNGF